MHVPSADRPVIVSQKNSSKPSSAQPLENTSSGSIDQATLTKKSTERKVYSVADFKDLPFERCADPSDPKRVFFLRMTNDRVRAWPEQIGIATLRQRMKFINTVSERI